MVLFGSFLFSDVLSRFVFVSTAGRDLSLLWRFPELFLLFACFLPGLPLSPVLQEQCFGLFDLPVLCSRSFPVVDPSFLPAELIESLRSLDEKEFFFAHFSQVGFPFRSPRQFSR